MSFDPKQALWLMETMNQSALLLREMPEMIPVVQQILGPVLNGAPSPVVGARKGRVISAETRERMRAAAQKRWHGKGRKVGSR